MSGKYEHNIHHRRSIRLPCYDYSQDGWYFVTMCALGHNCLFGKFADGQIQLYEYGRSIEKCWKWLAEQYDYVHLDRYVIMPNHMHGIIVILRSGSGKGGSRTAPTLNNAYGQRHGNVIINQILQINGYFIKFLYVRQI